MAGMLRVSRSRGAFSGLLLVLLGLWGGLIPLVGPYVNYAYSPDKAWTVNSGRIWLEILPAVATIVGGLLVLISRLRPVAVSGASLAVVSGAWFALGGVLEPLWSSNVTAGNPLGGHVARVLEQIGFFTGLGLVIICIASVALGRLTVVSVRDTAIVRDIQAASETEPEGPAVPGRSSFVRRARLTRVASHRRGREPGEGDLSVSRETVDSGTSN